MHIHKRPAASPSIDPISLDDNAMQANHNHLQEHDDGSELELPDDALANVLGRLPPISLAASRCVRKHWRSLIDARRLLRADLLPLHLDAFFFNPSDLEYRPSFFASPSATRRIAGRHLDFSDTLREHPYIDIMDHCNGLILLWEKVLNPATRQLANLPAFPAATTSSSMAGIAHPDFYLAYDPFLSPQHYEVVPIPSLFLVHPPNSSDDDGDGDVESSEERHLLEHQEIDLSAEWPPSPYATHVFCSRKWRWEERSFIRQGEPAGTIADMARSVKVHCEAVYFRGALYVHCKNDSVMRIALSDDTYQMIESPPAWTKVFDEYPHLSYLGKSEKGVYTALVDQDDGDSIPRCRVWLLNEERLGHHPEWVLKSNISLVENIPLYYFANKYDSKPWTLDDYNKERRAPAQDELDEWDFDDDIVHETTPAVKPYSQYSMVFLGFHPYKEIVFFRVSSSRASRALSYHLDTLKVQDLGTLRGVTELESSFPYTPCWMEDITGLLSS